MNTSQLLQELSDDGIRLWEKDGRLQFRAPKGAINESIKKEISKRRNEIISLLKSSDHDHKPGRLSAEPDLENRYTPFPLSDVQSAYLIGRNEAFDLGNIACHSYYELEQSEIDVTRLNSALNKLIEKHETLKLIFMEDGTQKILKKVPQYKIKVSDLRDLNEESARRQHNNIRDSLSHKIHDAGQWPLFEAGAILFKDYVRLYFSLDLLVADFFSAFILFRDLVKYYDDPEAECQPVEFSFRDYVLKEHELTESKQFLTSRDYWINRIDSFPFGPQLPFAKEPGTIKKPEFVRREFVLDQALWSALKKKSANYELTPSVVLMTAYSEILSRWSKTNHFAINLTLFNRLPVHPDVMNIAGDFTCVNLLEVNTGTEKCFKEKAEIIQNRLWEDLDNRHFSGIKFIRELARLHNAEGKALMPVVFSSTIGVENKNLTDFEVKRLGSLKYGITQTPQVFLDHQVIEHEERLFYNWDAVEAIFPENLLNDMFEAYTNFIVTLSKDDAAWNRSIDDLIFVKSPVPWINVESDKSIAREMLHTLFEKQANAHPEKNAVVTSDRTLSYKELNVLSSQIGEMLRNAGALPGALIGVMMEKGWEQVAGALGVLKSGAAYLPIDPKLPVERLNHLLTDGGVRIVLTQSKIRDNFPWPGHLNVYEVDKINGDGFHPELSDPVQSPDDLAYVIYTSGSTGLPKGVMIDHNSAVNTILDVNDRFAVTPDDKIFSLAAMNFDLSVYDFFGTLAAGATIVIPDHKSANDPAHWLSMINAEGITVWNSVPQLMQMLTEYLSDRKNDVSDSLRLVMMSGDWIPLDLPEKIRLIFRNTDIYSLGGATEASIWSICYPIKEINPHWKSIPYGRSMKNQNVYVLNKNFEFCPVWVTGDLYIEGRGLATGYLNDKEKTDASFMIHPKTKQRLYKTGDLGRYLPDGNIEFLGREDAQVKVKGYRVELGEIEAAIKQHPGVKDAIVYTTPKGYKEKELLCCIIPDKSDTSSLFESENADLHKSNATWQSLTASATLASKNTPDKNSESFLDFWHQIENLAPVCMYNTFNKLGAFKSKEEKYSVKDLLRLFKIQSRYEKLVGQWLEVLEKRSFLIRDDQNQYKSNYVLKEDHYSSLWAQARTKANQDHHAEILFNYFNNCTNNHVAMFRGDIDPLELFFPDGSWEIAETLYQYNPISRYYNGIVSKIVEAIVISKEENSQIKVIEVGAGTGSTTASLLPVLPSKKTIYYHTDLTDFFKTGSQNKFQSYPFIKYEILDINKSPEIQGFEPHSFDVLVAANVLHDAKNINVTINHLQSLLKPYGFMIIMEATENSNTQMISFGFLEGLSHFDDERVKHNRPLLSSIEWVDVIKSAGLEKITCFPGIYYSNNDFIDNSIMLVQAPLSVTRFNPIKISKFLSHKIPEYMIPSSYVLMEKFPITANGKINRKALPVPYEKKPQNKTLFKLPASKTEILLAQIWTEILKIDPISVHNNFFDIGGDSLMGTRIIAKVRERTGLDISLRMLFEFPTIQELSEQIEILSKETICSDKMISDLPQIIPDKRNVNEPFSVTDVQHAYLMGRIGLYELGKVSAHCYFEFEGYDPEIEKLNRALNRLILHHDMMRSVFIQENMQQVILKEVPEYKIETYNFTNMLPKEAETELLNIRHKMSHQMISIDQWPLFDIRLSLHSTNSFRLHISFDNSVFDGWSMFHLISELSRLYSNPEDSLPELDLSFRDYVLAMENIKDSALFKKDRDYWLDHLNELPPSPALPMMKKPETGTHYPFTRFGFKMKKENWENLKRQIKAIGITPSGFLLSAYAEILHSRSANNQFTINLTTFNRVPVHKQVNEIVGDFTSLTLVRVNYSASSTFKDRAQNLQKQLWQDMDHPFFGGVQVLRELAKLKGGKAENARMPIVFTSALGLNSSEQKTIVNNSIGRLNYSISQTPQVLIDHQVYETGEELVLTWDIVKEVFPEGFIEDMFDAYIQLLETLAQNKRVWEKHTIIELNNKQKSKRVEINNTASELPDMTLHSMFEQSVIKRPLAQAIITSTKRLSYMDLSNYSEIIAQMLTIQGAMANTLIAIVMDKGWEQIAAVLGILKSGAAYLPISSDTPEERLKNLLNDGGVKIVLTQSWLENEIKWPGNVELFCIDEIDSLNTPGPLPTKQHKKTHHTENLAYVIYTSGSTGQPKGVMIDHRGAVNTILDINEQFSINAADKVLALAALNFDLSVYDIFGTLAAGGTIVIPEPKSINDPACWAELIKSEGITIWNSVPQLMRMFTDHAEAELDDELAQSLRLVLLSGDWIPTDLPNKIKSVFNNTQVISLGGATEASIWSIFYPIEHIDLNWKSIPYGRPMSNQKFHVLNENMEHCPDWTTGHLYIGGIGLAKGYWNDQEKTKSVFVTHPVTGERLYRTGDLGRYLPDGNIEFQGREDFQVKVNGYRVETGEIESVLKQYPGLKNTVVHAANDQFGNKYLIGYLVLENSANFIENDLKEFLKQKLPAYMVPSFYETLEALPITPNGKIDRKQLPKPGKRTINFTKEYIAPHNKIEQTIADSFQEITGIEQIGIYDNFFDLGVDSMHLVKIQTKLKKDLKKPITIVNLFEYPTITSLAEFLTLNKQDNSFMEYADKRAKQRNIKRGRRLKSASQ